MRKGRWVHRSWKESKTCLPVCTRSGFCVHVCIGFLLLFLICLVSCVSCVYFLASDRVSQLQSIIPFLSDIGDILQVWKLLPDADFWLAIRLKNRICFINYRCMGLQLWSLQSPAETVSIVCCLIYSLAKKGIKKEWSMRVVKRENTKGFEKLCPSQ